MRFSSGLSKAAVAAAVFLPNIAAAAFDPAVDTECPNQGVCLSSFIWCSGRDLDCSFPDNADAFSAGAAVAVLYHGEKYDISWRQANAESPVLVEWLLEAFDSLEEGDTPGRVVIWSTNATGNSFAFDPEAILAEFPIKDAPEISSAQAILGAQAPSNQIRISQPGSGYDAVWSNQFLVVGGWPAQFVVNLKEANHNAQAARDKKWQLGVGIGVGLGVPILVAATWLIARRRGPSETVSLAK